MKIQPLPKAAGFTPLTGRKIAGARTATRIQGHRHERRKIREQLRHPEWVVVEEI